ncbi:hypothetical protein ACOSP7_026809 [Xanthoceras sorbifolium]
MQGETRIKTGKAKVISTPKKIIVDNVDTTNSKGSRFKILEDRLEEDMTTLENKIRGKISAGALWDITNGNRCNKQRKENVKGKLKIAFK